MKTKLAFRALALLILTTTLACQFSDATPRANPNAFNTMVAQTALARPTLPPPPTFIPATAAPTITPTQGPPVLVNASVNLPRHTAQDLETKAISGVLADMNKLNRNLPDLSQYYKKAPPGSDLVYYSENPTDPSWQFLYPVNGTRVVFPKPELWQAGYDGCIQAFSGGMVVPGKENEAFPLDYYVFVTAPGQYYCFTTDRGNLGAFKVTAPGDYRNMAYVIVEYILWDAKLP